MKLESRKSRRLLAGCSAAITLVAGLATAEIPGVAAAAPASGQAAKAHFRFTTIDNPADLTFNQLLGINSSHVIAGYFGSGATNHPNQGYFVHRPYKPSDFVSENFPGSVQTQVTAINNVGDTAGFWVDAKGDNHGFIEWNGIFTSYNDPKTPHRAGSVNQLLGINDDGIAVGFYTDASGDARAYTLNQATRVFTPVTVPGGTSTTATGINNEDQIVGFATSSGNVTFSFLLSGGHLTAFQFPGGSDTQAFGVNDSDQVVGSYLDGSGVMHGFVLSDPTGPHPVWKTVDDPNGIGSTVVNGINDQEELVGFYMDSSGNTDGFLAK